MVQLPVANAQLAASQYSKQKPYEAALLTSQKITGRSSGKDVRHIEIDLEGSGLTYQREMRWESGMKMLRLWRKLGCTGWTEWY